MTGIVAPPPVEPRRERLAPLPAATQRPRAGRKRRPRTEAAALFVVALAAYLAIGYQVVVVQHVAVFDALSRLSHGFFVWWDTPPKLAAIGFEWPPLMTLVFLPLTLVKPMATSLIALPLASAPFAAALVVLLSRTLALLGLPWWQRIPLAVAFGANPLIVFYASNGMGEAPYLLSLVAGVYFLLRWDDSGAGLFLGLAGFAFAIGTLLRYEVALWALVVGTIAFAALIWRRKPRDEVSGTMLLYAAPLVYGLGLWTFFNWTILGSPLYWLAKQAGSNVSVGRGGATEDDLAVIPLPKIAEEVLSLNWRLFPLGVVVAVALLVVALVRRDAMSWLLAAVICLNAALTCLLVFMARDESLLQLRYNMRAMPLAVVGVGWLWVLARWRWARFGVFIAALAILVATIPGTWHMMRTYQYQFQEAAFAAALSTGEDQEGTEHMGYTIGVGDERDMAARIRDLTDRQNTVLTDDAQTFAVMLFSNDPGIFVDRPGMGDKRWKEVLQRPWGQVPYILLSRDSSPDLVRECYPQAIAGRMPGLTPIEENKRYVLFRVAPHMPKIVEDRLRAAGPGATPCAK